VERDGIHEPAAAGLEDPAEPPLQLLLEWMNRTPDQYRNVIFMNLHGELLPMPPFRNYSDPAKDPEAYPQWRVVAHPEKLRNPGGAVAVRYRVYAWLDDPSVADTIMEKGGVDVPITFRIRDVLLTPADVSVGAITGGLDQDGVAGQDDYIAVAPAPTVLVANKQYYTMTSYTDAGIKWTEFQFYNTPLKCPPRGATIATLKGLPNGTAVGGSATRTGGSTGASTSRARRRR